MEGNVSKLTKTELSPLSAASVTATPSGRCIVEAADLKTRRQMVDAETPVVGLLLLFVTCLDSLGSRVSHVGAEVGKLRAA